MTFAVTGANGFLGVYILHHLVKKGHHVKALVRPSSSLNLFNQISDYYQLTDNQKELIEWVHVSLYDTYALNEVFENVDYVIHLAGKISYLKRELPDLIHVNRDFTAAVVDACLSANVKRLIYCSSTSAISKNNTNAVVVESKEWDDKLEHSNYGYTKHLGEMEVWRGIEEGLAANIINPGVILGYANWNDGSNKLFRNAFQSFPFFSEGITGFVGVSDVADIVYRLCNSEVVGEQFLVISENKSYGDIARMMAKHFDKKPPRFEVKGLLYRLIYGFISLKERLGLGGLLSKETVKASIAKNQFSNQKIKDALNYEFESMEEVISAATEAYKKSPPK